MSTVEPASDPATSPSLPAAGGFDALIGTDYREAGPDRVVAVLRVRPALHQPYGITHGGVWCALVESLASVGGALWLGDRGRVVGVSNSTDFYRAVSEGDVTGVATPVHRGRSQQVWQVVVTDDRDRTVARGQVRLQNLDPDRGPGS